MDAGDPVEVEARRIALRHQDAVLAEQRRAVAVEPFREEVDGRIDGVGRVNEDEVVLLAVGNGALHKGDAVVDDDAGLGVVERRSHIGEVLTRDADDLAVDVDEVGLFDLGVPEHLAERAAVAAADDEHPLGRRMCEHGHVRQHLVVAALVTLGHVGHAAEGQDHAVVEGLKDLDLLERRLERLVELRHREGEEGVLGPGVEVAVRHRSPHVAAAMASAPQARERARPSRTFARQCKRSPLGSTAAGSAH